MATFPSATPSSRRAPAPVRRFTLEQANRALPLVRRIVNDIVQTHRRAAELQAEILTGLAKPEVHAEQKQLLQRLGEFAAEMKEIGCQVKDPSVGLVDFITRHQGRDVMLCWKLDEPEIGHWHEMDGGFAGRQPIQTLEPGE